MIKLISGSLFLALTFSAHFASASPAIFCEEINSTRSWVMCSDSGYSASEHKPPVPGTAAAGGFHCTNGYKRCTYSAQYAEGSGFVPPPPTVKKVDASTSFFELAGNYIEGFTSTLSSGITALFNTSDRPSKDLIGTSGGATQTTLPGSLDRSLSGGTMSVKLNPATVDSVTYPGVTLSGTPEQVVNDFRRLDLSKLPPKFIEISSYPWVALQGRAGSVSVVIKPTGGCPDFSNQTWNSNYHYYTTTYPPNTTEPCAVLETYNSLGQKQVGAQSPTFKLSNYDWSPCPVGYSPNSTTPSKCTLTDVEAANADRKSDSSSLFDGVCPISVSGANPFDPDCNLAKNNGTLRSTYNAAGTPVTVAKDSTGTQVAVTHSQPPVISRTVPQSDGGSKREDATVPQRQPMGPSTQTYNPATPVAAFPGDTSSGSGGGSLGSFCGTPGQPPCAVAGLEGVTSAINDLKGAFCGGPGQSPCSISGIEGLQGSLNSANSTLNNINAAVLGNTATLSGISEQINEFGDVSGAELGTGIDAGQDEASQPSNLDGFFSQMFAFSRFTAQDPGYSCYQALSTADDATSVSYLGDTLNLDMQVSSICPLIEPRESTILATTELLWLVMAILIFIRFTI